MDRPTFNKQYEETHVKCSGLMVSKSADYAGDDVLANFKRLSEAARVLRIDPGKDPGSYALFMVLMKLDRWQNLRVKGSKPNNESIQDTVIDLHNYTDLAFACDSETCD